MKKRTVKVKILDEVNVVLIGLTKDHIEFFYDSFKRRPPNHFFNPKFKLGSWDGYIRYFHKTCKTHVYLLNEIIPKLIAFGYKINLIDERQNRPVEPLLIDKDYFSHLIHSETGKPVEFRPYQVEGVNALIENGGGIVIAGTGAGKTLMNAVLIDLYGQLGLKTITIVPTSDLILQTKLEFIDLELDVGEYSGDEKDINHTHVVSTWQALQNNPSIIKQFQVVVVDEAHGLQGQVLTKLLNDHGKNITYRFGLTGTLPKAETDVMAVRIAVGDVQYTIPAQVLIEQGWLASLHINIMQLEEDFEEAYAKFCKEFPLEKIFTQG